MTLAYKEDWEEAKNALMAWWEGELRRPLIQVVAPKRRVARWFLYDSWDFCRYPDQPEIAVKRFEQWCSTTFFGGAAYPNLWINFGPGILAAFLGASPVFTGDTMWFGSQRGKGVMRLEEVASLKLDEGNVWWRRVVNATRVAVRAHRGRFIVGMTDIGGVLDVIASLRGTVELLKDLYRRPSKLEDAIWAVVDLWHECYNRLHTIITEGGQEGTSAWMGIWCRERWYPFQCDIAFMMSPSIFAKFVAPHIREQCNRLEYSIYHLDGPGQIPHLKYLLEIDELTGVQWVPGAREELRGHDCGSPKWYGLYRRILSAGKALVVAMPPTRVPGFLKKFHRGRILIQTWAASEDDAKALEEAAQ